MGRKPSQGHSPSFRRSCKPQVLLQIVMTWLLDTNVLLRSAQPNHTLYRDAVDATDTLIKRGETVVIIPQIAVNVKNSESQRDFRFLPIRTLHLDDLLTGMA